MGFDKEMRDALRADQAKLESKTGNAYPIYFIEPNYDCEGCQVGDKWPVTESVWLCPVCDTEYLDTDAVSP